MDTATRTDSPLIMRRLKQKSRLAQKAKESLYDEVRIASAAGWSLRQIADVVGVSHVQVKRIVEGDAR